MRIQKIDTEKTNAPTLEMLNACKGRNIASISISTGKRREKKYRGQWYIRVTIAWTPDGDFYQKSFGREDQTWIVDDFGGNAKTPMGFLTVKMAKVLEYHQKEIGIK